MGYTHYWKLHKDFTDSEWAAMTAAAQKIIDVSRLDGDTVQFESDNSDPPVIDAEHIRFNGINEDGHETFVLSRKATDFEFCKTARKPYDAVVVACLITADEICNAFEWSSDGDGEADYKLGGEMLIEEAAEQPKFREVEPGIHVLEA